MPTPSANSAITWTKVAASITNQPGDKLIVEGYPLLKDGMAVVLVPSCKPVLTEQAAKAQKADHER